MFLSQLKVLILVKVFTYILHLWVLYGQRLSPQYLLKYKKDLQRWNRRKTKGLKETLKAYKTHPAWEERYLYCSCYNYAIAYSNVYRKTSTEVMRNIYGKLIHVYSVKTVKDYMKKNYTKKICYDITGRQNRLVLRHRFHLNYSTVEEYRDEEDGDPYRFPGELYVLEMWIRAIQ